MAKETKRCNFDFPIETVELLDKIKSKMGFQYRTNAIIHLIHNYKVNGSSNNISVTHTLSATMVFCVGVLRANIILEIFGGAFVLYLFAKSRRS